MERSWMQKIRSYADLELGRRVEGDDKLHTVRVEVLMFEESAYLSLCGLYRGQELEANAEIPLSHTIDQVRTTIDSLALTIRGQVKAVDWEKNPS